MSTLEILKSPFSSSLLSILLIPCNTSARKTLSVFVWIHECYVLVFFSPHGPLGSLFVDIKFEVNFRRQNGDDRKRKPYTKIIKFVRNVNGKSWFIIGIKSTSTIKNYKRYSLWNGRGIKKKFAKKQKIMQKTRAKQTNLKPSTEIIFIFIFLIKKTIYVKLIPFLFCRSVVILNFCVQLFSAAVFALMSTDIKRWLFFPLSLFYGPTHLTNGDVQETESLCKNLRRHNFLRRM